MPKPGDVHVIRGNNGGWQVRVEGKTRAQSIHNTQAEAAVVGKEIARRNKSERLIHGRDGRIRDRSTFGHDPRRTRG
jgi:hypothetical protein